MHCNLLKFIKTAPLVIVILLFSATIAECKPLEGIWKDTSDGPDLVLNPDDSFTWGELAGKWFIDSGALLLHSPRRLTSYSAKLEGSILTLSGGNLGDEKRRFQYSSGGIPVPPPSPPLKQTIQQTEAPRDTVPPTASLADHFPTILPGPICGVWAGNTRMGYLDTLCLYASRELRLEGRGNGIYKQVGDRLYVDLGAGVEEWYFLAEEQLMAVSYNSISSPRAYEKMNPPSRRYTPSDLGSLAGLYQRKRRAPSPIDDPYKKLYFREELEIGTDSRITGRTISPQGELVMSWSGYASPVKKGIELRHDDGTLRIVTLTTEYHSEYGRLLEMDGMVYLQEFELPADLDTSERLNAVDASRIRRDLNDVLRQARQNMDDDWD